MKKIVILGSTGSIGKSALEVVRHLKSELKIVALTANENIDLLEAQAKEFQPELVVLQNRDKAHELQKRLPWLRVSTGMEGLEEAASLPSADIVLTALSGAIGIVPTVIAIKSGKTIALANKEVLIAAGRYVIDLAQQMGVSIIPVDSEHSALFQCLRKENPSDVHRLILTASGGPFLHTPKEKLLQLDAKEALQHPTYRMGAKISVDSSTLMNKGLEVIEAHFLFGVPPSHIDVVVHPQSIIHSLIEMKDGSILAQLSEPNMQLPIQYAFTYPDRAAAPLPYFNFAQQRSLEFFPPDCEKFPCLGMAYEALRVGGTMPCYMNAVNEVLVHQFLEGKISWIDISNKLEKLMAKHRPETAEKLETILSVDMTARDDALYS